MAYSSESEHIQFTFDISVGIYEKKIEKKIINWSLFFLSKRVWAIQEYANWKYCLIKIVYFLKHIIKISIDTNKMCVVCLC